MRNFHSNKSIKAWLSADLSFGILSVIVNLSTIPIFVLNLGIDNYGNWIFCVSIVGFMSLFTLGLPITVVKRVNENSELENIRRIANNSFWAQVLLIFMILGVGATFALIAISLKFDKSLLFCVTILGLSMLISMLSGAIHPVLNSIGKGYVSALIAHSTAMTQILSILAVSFFTTNIIMMAYVYFLISIIFLSLNFYIIYKYLHWFPIIKNLEFKSVLDFFKLGKNMQIIHISEVVSAQFPILLAFTFWGPQAVTAYHVMMRIPNLLSNSIIMKICSVFYPRLQTYWENKNYTEFWRSFFLSQYLSITYGIGILILLSFFLNDILAFWQVDEVQANAALAILVGVTALRDILIRSSGIFLLATGDFNTVQKIVLFETFIMVASGLVLTPAFGLKGILLSFSISGIYYYTRVLYFQRSQFAISYDLKNILNFMLLVIVVLVAHATAYLYIGGMFAVLISIVVSCLIEGLRYWRNRFGSFVRLDAT